MKIGKYAKTVVAAILAGAYALQAAISDGTITNTEWVGFGTAVLISIGVLTVPNAPQSVILVKPATENTRNTL